VIVVATAVLQAGDVIVVRIIVKQAGDRLASERFCAVAKSGCHCRVNRFNQAVLIKGDNAFVDTVDDGAVALLRGFDLAFQTPGIFFNGAIGGGQFFAVLLKGAVGVYRILEGGNQQVENLFLF